jgi:hypothetical protein
MVFLVLMLVDALIYLLYSYTATLVQQLKVDFQSLYDLTNERYCSFLHYLYYLCNTKIGKQKKTKPNCRNSSKIQSKNQGNMQNRYF